MAAPSSEEKIVCPHCGTTFRSQWSKIHLGTDSEGQWLVRRSECAECRRVIAFLQHYAVPPLTELTGGAIPLSEVLVSERLIRPRSANRRPIPSTLPKEIAEDYIEAANVMPESPKASAALSRRCLQSLLVTAGGAQKRDLFDQIQEVVDAGILTPELARDLDAVRVIGAFAAHPIKSKSTGQIVPVETQEAEWNLEVLDDLFDFFYVQPERRKAKRATLDVKLKEAGKPTLDEVRKKKS